MKISIQGVNFNALASLEEHVEKKVGKLETFYDHIVSCKVILKLENSQDKENKTAEIILGIPGDDLVVKKTKASFEESIDDCVDAVKKLLIKKKEKVG